MLCLGISTLTNFVVGGDCVVGSAGLGGAGDEDAPTRNLSEIFGFFASSSFCRQSLQTKWKSSFSAAALEMPKHLLCCQTLHLSQATL